MLTTSLLLGLILGLCAITAAAYGLPFRGPGPRASIAPTPQPAKQHRGDVEMQPLTGLHTAPAEAPSRSEAHHIMQLHCECSAAECGRKAAAFDALVSAGVIKTSRAR